ncbi:cation-translocating P-type ATPase [Lyngbya confervoides]|uniref:Cation-transporting P-type ATPase n=1 Tax=Lyngbya confervoides BDU141951 TaxID=1574623 RepID=A0ABD4T354_9CYAN|nr:cation-transporting P-type ATPase [Lyngbya confervoides]MCM1982954.1 cation-transporting P-type ATPase [Lyngbya confervoides BDU141951]
MALGSTSLLVQAPSYTLSGSQVLDQYHSDRHQGLGSAQVEQRQAEFGLNMLQEVRGRTTWQLLLDQFKNIMLLMLIAVAVVSLVLDLQDRQFPKDAIAIMSIVILNGWLGFVQESRAEKALAALKSMSSPRVRVLREGREQEVEAQYLVPGDILYLEAGVRVPADARLLEAINLQIRESALTGESEAVVKNAAAELSLETSLGDRVNTVYQGTEVVQGRGWAVVVATGMATELGKIAALLQGVEAEPTPLQQRMGELGNVLVSGSLVLVALVVLGGVLRTGSFAAVDELLEVSLSMAVAVVPEGLPAVITVTLALGTQRMVRRQALIRRLPAVETLGSVTTICSDKTGTLTQNKMVAQKLVTWDRAYAVSGVGYDPTGEFLHAGEPTVPLQDPVARRLLLAGVLCNDAALQRDQGHWAILGDPTEGALRVLGQKAGLEAAALSHTYTRIAEVPFSSERKQMSVVCRTDPSQGSDFAMDQVLFSKGSPEAILACSDRICSPGDLIPLTPQCRDRLLQQNQELAAQGLRVLGVAYRPLSHVPDGEKLADCESHLIWLGMVGILDPARPEAKLAVERCRQAGIRPVMITGDHQLTALAIAQEIGIAQPGDRVLRGQDLETLTPEALEREVEHVNVYARVAPEHKLKIVQALQRRHEFVAMTGDGVNDAPALKQADIGIAMGITGTDVSKEASDMVLLDDNFATIVAATEEGRVIYGNIRRFVKYILGSNIGEVITVAAAPLLGLGGVPLSPLQILWMNLVTDGLPALALAVEPADCNVMRQPPRDPRESIFARGLGWYMVRVGLVLAILSIGLMSWAYGYTHAPGYGGDPDTWKTMVFTTLCLAQMGHALAVRSEHQLTYQLDPRTNPYLWGAIFMTTALQLLLLYVPALRTFFGVTPLGWVELGVCLGVSSLMFIWIELEKVFLRGRMVR